MIDMQQFENIKEKHGRHASWAVWADASEKAEIEYGRLERLRRRSRPELTEERCRYGWAELFGF